jgi:hypothetical protein
VATIRPCSRQTCRAPAVATLTYVYADSMAVLGPLSASAEPHSYDLCEHHATRLSAPQGWSVLRITSPADERGDDRPDDRMAGPQRTRLRNA